MSTERDPLLTSELARMAALKPSNSAAVSEREAMHERHVHNLAGQLKPLVAEALADEGASWVASEWVGEAQTVAAWLTQGSEPSGSAGVQRAADRALEDELAATLANEEEPPPSAREVDEHATELAQLLLSNWFSLLEHALQDAQGNPVALVLNALPPATPADALVAGCEAFALPLSTAAKALLRYQEGLVGVGGFVQLSPTMLLRRGRLNWHVFRVDLSRPLRVQAPLQLHQEEEEVPIPAMAAMHMTSPWCVARSVDLLHCWGSAGPDLMSVEDEERIALVAAHKACSRGNVVRRPEMTAHLLHAVAAQILSDLNELQSAAGTVHDDVAAGRQLCRLDRRISALPVENLYRIGLASTAACMVYTQQAAIEARKLARDMPEGWDAVVDLAADVVRAARAEPDASAIRTRLQLALGVASDGDFEPM